MAIAPMAQGLLPLTVPPGFSAHAWVDTVQTQLIRESLNTARAAGQPERLWLHGASGVGKTHCVVRLVEDNAGVYLHASTIHPSEFEPIVDTASLWQWVVIDGVEAWLGDRGREEAIFSLWKRYPGVLLFTARMPPHHIDWLLPDLQSRARSALVLPLTRLDDAGLVELLSRQCDARGLVVSDDVMAFLAHRMPRHPATLIRWIDALDQRSLEAQRRLTIPWIRSVLPEL